MELDDFVAIRKDLLKIKKNDSNLFGEIARLTERQIILLQKLEDCIAEIKDINKKLYLPDQLHTLKNKKIFIQFAIGEIPNYFESFSDFIINNKYSFDLDKFYIYDEKVSDSENLEHPLMQAYLTNINFIAFLCEIADNKNSTAGNLTLYFHKVNRSLKLPIDYNYDDLKSSNLKEMSKFIEDIKNGIHKEDRKKLFVNNLADFSSSRDNKYSSIIKEWIIINENYTHSFNIYLEGFSFEKIKTSSIEHFQELSEKINETIRKVSNYLFAIPVAFVFLTSRLDYENSSLPKNISLMFLGYLFTFIIWEIFFKNIKESLDSIKEEINRYEDKIKNVKDLRGIKSQLENLKDISLQNQYKKLKTLKVVTFLIVLILTLAVCFIYLTEIIKISNQFFLFLKSILNI